MSNTFFIIFYFVIILFISLFVARKQTRESFLISDRNLSSFPLVSTIVASLIGGNAIVVFTTFIFLYGISAFWGFIGLACGCLCLIFVTKKVKSLADEKKFYTLSDFFYEKYGKSVGLLIAFTITLTFFILLLIQIIAGSIILSKVIGLSYVLSVFIVTIVVFLYLFAAGFKAVVKTDILQYFVILIPLLIIAIFLSAGKGITVSQFNPFRSGFMSILFFLYGLITVTIGADMWQRIYAGKSFKIIKKSLIISAITLPVIGIGISMIGFAAKANFPNILAEEALIYGISYLLPVGLSGLALVVLFAAIMSTIDTITFVLATNFSKDFVSRLKTGETSKKDLVALTRLGIFLFIALALVIALFYSKIINIALSLGSITFVLAPTIIGSLYIKLKRKAILLSISSGLFYTFLMVSLGFIRPETVTVSLFISLASLVIGQKIFK